MELISRKEARLQDLVHYFTGKPCKRGHLARRVVLAGNCCVCMAARTKAWKLANRERYRVLTREAGRRDAGLPAPTRPCPATCENCGQPPGRQALHLDHCHSTGKFRGWLCNRCNLSIGNLGDTVESIERARDYLVRASL